MHYLVTALGISIWDKLPTDLITQPEVRAYSFTRDSLFTCLMLLSVAAFPPVNFSQSTLTCLVPHQGFLSSVELTGLTYARKRF